MNTLKDTRAQMPRSRETARKGPSAATSAAKSAKVSSASKSPAPSKASSNKASSNKAALSKAATKVVAAKAAAAKPWVDEDLHGEILNWLDEAKAENVVSIDIKGKSSIGDWMVIATGRSDRHVGAIAAQLQTKLKEFGVSNVRAEGTQACDWVLVDVGAIIVHLFRPEVREFYNLEKMWSGERPGERPVDHALDPAPDKSQARSSGEATH